MNRFRFLVVLLAVLLGAPVVISPLPARAACGSNVPYVFTDLSDTVDAVTTNANNAFLLSCTRNVDHTQIGAAGLYASQLQPDTAAHATFGGSLGYTFAPPTPGVVPLTVTAPAGATTDALDIYLGTTPELWVDSTGLTHIAAVTFQTAPTFSGDLHVGGSVYAQQLSLMAPSSAGTATIAGDNAPVAGILTTLPNGTSSGERTIIAGFGQIRQLDRTGTETLYGGLNAGSDVTTSTTLRGAGVVVGAAQISGSTTTGSLASGPISGSTGTFTGAVTAASLSASAIGSTGAVTGASGSFGPLLSNGTQALVGPSSGTRWSSGVIPVSISSCGAGSDCSVVVTASYAGGAFGARPRCYLTPETPLFLPTIVPASTNASTLAIDVTNVSNTTAGASSFNVDYACFQ